MIPLLNPARRRAGVHLQSATRHHSSRLSTVGAVLMLLVAPLLLGACASEGTMKAEEVPVDTTAAFWQPASPLNGGPVVALAADEAGNLFASGTGLYRRPAAGPGTDVEWGRKPSRLFTNTYTEELGRVPLFESYDRMTSAGNTVYASSRGFLLRSRNHGQSWVDVQRAILDFQGGRATSGASPPPTPPSTSRCSDTASSARTTLGPPGNGCCPISSSRETPTDR